MAMAQLSSPMRSPQETKPRLPRLRPNINKKAQQIIAAHMHSTVSASSAFSSTATVPVLTQIQSTASRTARSHDISHLCDQSSFLAPCIPPSLIQESDHVYEPAFLPPTASSLYNEQDGMWYTKVFPSDKPSSRTDAVMLDAWITRSLERYQEMSTGAAKEDLARTVEDLVPILSVALHEIVRQVTHHCAERGVALEKIWRTYVELFDRVLRQMQESLRSQKQKTQEVQRVLQSAREDLQEVRRQHPKDMHRVISELEAKFTRHQQDSEDALNAADARNKELKEQLRKQHKELELWYPGFHFYQDSYIRNHIPNQTRATLAKRANITTMQEKAESLGTSSEAENEDIPTEVAIAEDFKRLLAVLAPDKRRTIGKELAVVLEGPSKAARSAVAAITGAPRLSAEVQEVAEEDTEALEQLKAEVNQQEERIAELRAEIARFESEQRLPTEVEAALAATAAQAED